MQGTQTDRHLSLGKSGGGEQQSQEYQHGQTFHFDAHENILT